MRRVILVVLFGLCAALTSGRVLAQCQSQFTSLTGGYVPFTSISYIAGPDAAGDFLVVGLMSSTNYHNLDYVPLPNVPNNRFCDTVPMSSTARYFAYVPTEEERVGNFSAFNGLIYDPTNFTLYASGQITDLPTPTTPGVFAWRIPPGESVFVSTGSGGQILTVDGNSGIFTVVSNGSVCDGCSFLPEGITVGPDNKIYMADPSDSYIYRMDQSGANFETVFSSASCSETGSCPYTPQGPIFSSGPAGDLYFSDPGGDSTNNIFKIAGAATTPLGGPFSSPVVVIPSSTISTTGTDLLGPGTAFDALDNLLFDDVTSNVVWSSSPPYNSVTSVGSVTSPGAIALNKATGQVYVAAPPFEGPGGQILPLGSTIPYYAFASDTPQFMKFDNTGHLFVTTVQNSSSPYHGRVWRLDPPSTSGGSPVPTLLLDLYNSWNAEQIASDDAVGIALLPMSGPPQNARLSGSGGVASLGWPQGCNPNKNNIPNTCNFTYGLSYPAGLFPDGATLTVQPTETSQAAWALRTPSGNGYYETQIAPVAGLGGDGIIFSVLCTYEGSLCPAGTQTYDATTTWQSTDPNYCTEGPQLLKADPIGSNNWVGTLISCSETDPQPKGTGRSCCTVSDWASIQGVPNTGGVTVTITTPPNNASYLIGQVVDASYSCTAPAGTGPVITACLGTVVNGSPIDTSSVGTKTFSVAANVTAGPGGAASTTYNVIASAVSVSPSGMNFGQVRVGTIAAGIVTVKNTGTAAMTISSVKIAPIPGGDSDDFFALSLCPRSPWTLGIGRSCFIIVSFLADADDFSPQSATLTITDNTPGSPQLVQLAATVVKKK